jgi:Cu-Zn family superoxide dismutase
MRRNRWTAALTGAGVVLLAGCGSPDEEGGPAIGETSAAGEAGSASRAVLRNAEGAEVGTVLFSEVSAGTEVVAEVQGLEAGFYGFHVHGTGLCEPDSAAPDDPDSTGDFLSAGGHLGADVGEHPEHAGDLPSLYVTENGEGLLMVVTDRFGVDDLTAGSGSAVMIHSGPDNFANVPERYAQGGPDEASRRTGDAGSRLACGVVE